MAKCNCCGREMLTANGCSYKRVVVKGAHKEMVICTMLQINFGMPLIRFKTTDSSFWTRTSLTLTLNK